MDFFIDEVSPPLSYLSEIDKGKRVFVNGRNAIAVAIAERLERDGAHVMRVNLHEEKPLAKAIEEMVAKHGGIDILVNNPGRSTIPEVWQGDFSFMEFNHDTCDPALAPRFLLLRFLQCFFARL